ncbi:hypothetical protein YC2023_049437 [Brassica napus]
MKWDKTRSRSGEGNPTGSPLTWIIPWVRLGSGPFYPGGLYLGWGQGPTPSTAFDDKIGSSPPPGVESGSMTIGPQSPYQTSYSIPSVNSIESNSKGYKSQTAFNRGIRKKIIGYDS